MSFINQLECLKELEKLTIKQEENNEDKQEKTPPKKVSETPKIAPNAPKRISTHQHKSPLISRKNLMEYFSQEE